MASGYVWHNTCPCCDGDSQHVEDCTLKDDCPDVYEQLDALWGIKADLAATEARVRAECDLAGKDAYNRGWRDGVASASRGSA